MKVIINEYAEGYRISWKPSVFRRWRTVETPSLKEYCPFRNGIHMVHQEEPEIRVNVDWCEIGRVCELCPVIHLDEEDYECPLLKMLVV